MKRYRRHNRVAKLAGERLEDRSLLAVLFTHDADDPVRAIAPSEADYDDFGLDWLGGSEPFDDAAWALSSGAPSGVGYDRGTTYDPLLGLDLEGPMYAARSTLFVRAAFVVDDPTDVDRLTLNLRYDDGFIAWLNGVEIARANAATNYPIWDATATAAHQASPATFDTFDLAAHIGLLRGGTNILAIRGLNVAAADDDALVQFTLVGERRTGPPLAVDDVATTPENAAVTIDVLANDQDGSDPIDPTTLSIAAPPEHGTATVNANGTITYTPSATYFGEDSFTYTVRDATGTGQTTQQTLVASNASVRAFVPANDNLGTTWRGGNEPFNDAAWRAGTFGVGYDTNPGGVDFNPFLGTNVQSALQNVNTTIYMRTAFNVANAADVVGLTLRMRYDDGFAAFLNGAPVASSFAPAALAYNSAAAGEGNGDANAVIFQNFNLTPYLGTLRTGVNVLAIHGLNQSVASSDLLMQPELIATVATGGRESNVATVTVNVEGVDFAPVADNDEYAVNPGTTIVAAPGVLANDTDADGDALTATLVSDVANGTLTLNSDGGFTYTPAAGFLGTDSFTYRAFDGGIESNLATVTIGVALSTTDFGDAPLPYPTTEAENGPLHEAIGPRLGATRDTEGDGAHSAAADGAADDDGVSFGTIRVGQLGATATVDVQNAPAGARLDAWIDFNADGSWGGPGEQIASGTPVVEGANTIRFDVPSWAADGQTFARFRISTAGHLGVRGPAVDGEIEDYAVTLQSPEAGGIFGGQNTISTTTDAPQSVFAADVDGDGDLDVLSASSVENKIAWYENDGRRGFTARTISAAAIGANSVFAADIDGDGDIDVLSASRDDDKIAWYENNGSQIFTSRTISTTADGALSVFAADVDGDGDMDVLSASSLDDKIAWYENNGSRAFTARIISTTADYASSTFAADVDGDGDVDVLSASRDDDRVVWYENDGGQAFTARIVSTSADGAYSVFAADVDGDGDLDVLSASLFNDRIVWHENDGTQSFTARTISFTANGARSVFAADMDGDGDVDVLSASEIDNKIAWYENDGAQTFTARTISTAVGGAIGVFAGDVDGDGDLDVFSASTNDDTIAWYENKSPPCSACADAYSVDEDATLVVDAATGVLANDGAQAGEILTAGGASIPSHGALSLSPDGSFIYTPNANYSGTDSFTYRVTSNQQGPRDVVVSITVNPLPDAPVAVNDAYTADSGVPLQVTATVAVDPTPRDETLVVFNATWDYLHPINGQHPATSDPDFSTTWQLGGAAYNGPAFSQGAAILGYGGIDYGPTATNIGTPPSGSRYTAYFRRTFELTSNAADVTALTAELLADDGAVIYLNGQRVALHNMPGGSSGDYFDRPFTTGSESQTYNITLDPAALVRGTNVLAVSVHNVENFSSDLGFALRLDARIVPDPDPVGVLVNDSDADGDALAAELVSPPAHGSLTLNADGTFVYTSNAGFAGVDTFQYRASDGVLVSLPAAATIAVSAGPNRPPTATDDAYAVDEDGEISIDAPMGVLANDTDPEQSPLTAAVLAPPQHGSLTLNADGSFEYAPEANYFGGDSFTYRASDGTAESNVASVALTIRPQPDAPIARDDAYTVDEGETLATTAGLGGAATTQSLVAAGETWLFRDTGQLPPADLQGDTWKEQDYDDTAWASGRAQLGYGDGDEVTVVSFGPDSSNKYITTWFRKHFTIAAGRAGLAEQLSLEVLRDDGVAVYVNGVEVWRDNLPGTLGDNLVTPTTGALIALSIPDESDFQPPVLVDLTAAAYRDLLRDGDNVVAVEVHQYDGFSTDISFDFRMSARFVASTGVLANDTEPDGETLTAVLETPPAHGTLALDPDGTFTYTPEPGYFGPDSFTYRASDGTLLSAVATATIDVRHEPPAAVADSYSTDEDTPLVVGVAAGVLANDSDSQGHALTAQLVATTDHGVLTLAADGSFSYVPEENYHGTDGFTYRASDESLQSPPVAVSIVVRSIDDAAVADDDAYQVVSGGTLTVDFPRSLGGPLSGGNRATPLSSGGQILYDGHRDILYRIGGGTIQRYHVPSHTLLTPFSVPTTITEGDITPNGRALYFADTATGPSVGYIQKVSLDDGVLTTLTYPRGGSEASGHDLAIGANGVARFSTAYSGSGPTPIRRLDTATDTFSGGGEAWQRTDLHSGPDQSLLVFINTQISSFPISLVDGITGSSIAGREFYEPTDGGRAAINRNGQLVALACCNAGLNIRDRGLNLVRDLPDISGTFAFDAARDIFYAIDPNADQLIAFDTANWVELYRVSTGIDPASYGKLLTSSNGQFAFVQTSTGVHTIDVLNAPQVLVQAGSAWKYLDDGSDQGTAWREPGFNDHFWSAGNAQLGYGDGDEETVVRFGGNASAKHATTYFRRAFQIDDPTALANVIVSLLADDGAAVYLNGVAVARRNVTAAATYATFAFSAVDGAAESQYFDFAVDPALLRQGENVLAVEAHIRSAADDDLSFDLRLTAHGPRPAGVLSNDIDGDGESLSAQLVAGPQFGTLNLRPDGTFVYQSNAGFAGTDTFTYRAATASGQSEPATVTIEVGAASGRPQAATFHFDAVEDTPLVVAAPGLLAGASDPEGSPLAVTLTGPPVFGSAAIAADGSFVYTPNPGFNGQDAFVFTATDGTETSNAGVVTITVSARGDAPVAVDDVFTIDRGTSLVLAAPGMAVETIATTTFAEPATGAVSYVGGAELGFTAATTPGNTELGVLASDEYIARGVGSPFTLSFDEVDISAHRQVAVRLDLRAHEDSSGSDFEDTDFFRATLGLTRIGGPVVLQTIVDLNGAELKAIDTGLAGAFTTYTASIPEGFLTATLTIETHVDSSTERVFFDNIAFTGVSATGGNVLLANDTDEDGDVLSVRIVSQPTHGVIETSEDGAMTYTPDALFVGTDTFTYVASDGQADSNVATVTVRVLLANLVPTATDDAYETDEDGTLVVSAAAGPLSNDGDLDGVALSLGVVSPPAHGTLLWLASGQFRYTPAADFFGTDSFTYVASDGRDDSNVATVTIAVNAVNDAPSTESDVYATGIGETLLAANDATSAFVPSLNQFVWSIADGGNGHVYELVSGDVLANWAQARIAAEMRNIGSVAGHLATITSATELSFLVSTGMIREAFLGGYQDTQAGNFSEPSGGWRWVTEEPWNFTNWAAGEPNNTDNVEHFLDVYGSGRAFQWNDTRGQQSHNAFWVEYPTNIVVNPRQPLVARNASWRYRDGLVNGSPYPSDAQGDRWNESDYDDVTWPAGGAILGYGGINAGPTVTTIRIAPDGGQTSITALFRRAVEITDAHRVASLTFDGLFDDGAAVYINGQEILRHNLPGNIGDGTLTPDTLTVTTGDESNYRLFTVDLSAFPGLLVEGTNVVAVEVHQVQITSSDLGFDLAITAAYSPDPTSGGVLGNDSDTEGDSITAALVAGPYHGTLAFESDGTFTYTPNAGFEGVDQFTYRASDGVAESAATLVTINVGDANEAPLAADDRYVARGGGPLTVAAASGVLGNDFDANGDALSATVFAPPARGTLSLAPDGGFVYTPSAGSLGADSFTYRVADDGGTFGFATATIHVVARVDPINGVPNSGEDAFAVTAGLPLSVVAPGVLANDADPERRPLFATVERSPWHGALSFASDGSFVYTPRAGFAGQDWFTYRATDGNTFSPPTTVTIDVAAAMPAGGLVATLPPGTTVPGSGSMGTSATGGLPGSTTAPDSVPLAGDANGDGRVDRADLALVVAAYGAVAGLPGYALAADVDRDGRVSLRDAIAVRGAMSAFGPISYAAGSVVGRVAPRLAERNGERVRVEAVRNRVEAARRPLAAAAVDTVFDGDALAAKSLSSSRTNRVLSR